MRRTQRCALHHAPSVLSTTLWSTRWDHAGQSLQRVSTWELKIAAYILTFRTEAAKLVGCICRLFQTQRC